MTVTGPRRDCGELGVLLKNADADAVQPTTAQRGTAVQKKVRQVSLPWVLLPLGPSLSLGLGKLGVFAFWGGGKKSQRRAEKADED